MSSRELVQNLKFRKSAGVNPATLSDFVSEQYMKTSRGPGFKTKTSFAPSSIAYGHGTCPRYWYLAFDGAYFEDKVDALGIANMAYGSQAHERLQKMFEDSGILVEAEREITPQDPPIRGFIDLIINYDGEEVVGEIKTTRQEIFLHRQTSMKPAPYHLIQLLIYIRATGNHQGFVLYENKNTQEILVIPVEMNERNAKILDDVEDWLRLVRKNWEEDGDTLPKRPFRKANKICKACPLQTECWEKKPEGTRDLPVMEVPKL